MQISLIVIGDEMLVGQVNDTNTGDIARVLAPAGWRLSEVCTVSDAPEAITSTLTRLLAANDVVLLTGGLGPTNDDVTKHVLARLFGATLRHDPDVARRIQDEFSRRGLTMNALTATQAMVPDNCTIIPNDVGTAPIMWFDRPGNKVVVSMPGVPFEMMHAFSQYVMPKLLSRFANDALAHRTLIFTGITESDLAEAIAPWENSLPSGLHLAYLPAAGWLRLRIDSAASTPDEARRRADEAAGWLAERFADNVIATADLSPAEILVERLRSLSLTLATAESCTGGNIAHTLTLLPGVSDVYVGGVVSYSNEVKEAALGVSHATLAANGAVSEPTAQEMAVGAAHRLGAHCAVSTTGIAGPSGAVPGKPVGTVCIAAHICPSSAQPVTVVKTFHFPGNRQRVIDRATTAALLLLLQTLDILDTL